MFVPQVSQTIVDHHSLSRAVPRWRSPPLRTLSAGRLKKRCPFLQQGHVFWNAFTRSTQSEAELCVDTQTRTTPSTVVAHKDSQLPPPFLPQPPTPPPSPSASGIIWPNCLGHLPAALSGNRRSAFATIGQQGEFLLAVGRRLNWGGHHHLGLALSPSQDVSQWTHFFFFSNPSFLIMKSPGAAPKPDMDYSGIIVDCSELSSSAGDPSQLNPQWKHKDEGRGQTLVLCAIFFFWSSSSAIPRL